MLVMECSYSTQDRDKHQRIQVDSATCATVSDLTRECGDLTKILRDLDVYTARYQGNTHTTYRYILIRVFNHDLPRKTGAPVVGVSKWAHWGFPKGGECLCSVQSVLTLINSGTGEIHTQVRNTLGMGK